MTNFKQPDEKAAAALLLANYAIQDVQYPDDEGRTQNLLFIHDYWTITHSRMVGHIVTEKGLDWLREHAPDDVATLAELQAAHRAVKGVNIKGDVGEIKPMLVERDGYEKALIKIANYQMSDVNSDPDLAWNLIQIARDMLINVHALPDKNADINGVYYGYADHAAMVGAEKHIYDQVKGYGHDTDPDTVRLTVRTVELMLKHGKVDWRADFVLRQCVKLAQERDTTEIAVWLKEEVQ
jgi:hypothetical protein